jgi:hypothetical protein
LSAAALLAEVSAAGVSLRLIDGGKVRAAGAVPPALLDRLRERKAELVALLRGDACRHCGAPMAWPAPVGLVFGDGTAAHHACHEKAEVARIMRVARNAVSPETLADPAEVTMRREPLP